MDPEAIEADAEVGELGERRLLRRPVEAVCPVGDELAVVGEVVPERPIGLLRRVRPRVARSRRRSSSTAGAVCGSNAPARRASGMGLTLQAAPRYRERLEQAPSQPPAIRSAPPGRSSPALCA